MFVDDVIGLTDPPGMRACPRCRARFHVRSLEKTPVDICTGCGGVWLDRGELSTFLEGRKTPNLPAAPRKPLVETTKALPCAECDVAMARMEYEGTGIQIDVCADHGVFFDAGEVQTIQTKIRERLAAERPEEPPMEKDQLVEVLARVNATRRAAEAREEAEEKVRDERRRELQRTGRSDSDGLIYSMVKSFFLGGS